jgi:serine/threonine-protein kinase
MPLIAVQGLLDQLRQHELLEPDQFAELTRSSLFRRGDARSIAQEMITRDWLTPFQANHLLNNDGGNLILGPYVLIDRLGSGGTGQVFKARHRTMRRLVALKIVRPDLLDNAEVVGRFRREVEVSSRLTHPHVIHAFDAGNVGSCIFMAMEYLPGSDLARMVKLSGPLSVAQSCDYIRQAALGLQHVCDRGLVHRDVKPANLLVALPRGGIAPGPGCGPWGLVKVLDLGLARLERPLDNEATVLTPAGPFMLGTPDYQAPEQAIDFHRADIRADIYGLGCSLYYLLAGQPPFTGSLAEKLLRHQNAEPPSLTSVRGDIPSPLNTVLRRMMAKKPDERYQTPREVADTLAQLSTGGRLSTRPASVTRAPSNAAGIRQLEPSGTGLSTTKLPPSPSSRRKGRRRAKLGYRWRVLLGAATLAVSCIVITLGLSIIGLRLGGSTMNPAEKNAASPAASGMNANLARLQAAVIANTERFGWQPKELVAIVGTHRGGHWGAVGAVAVNPNGDLVASGGEDFSVRLWNATSHEQTVLRGATEAVTALAFSSDGKELAAISRDGGVSCWDIQAGPTETHHFSTAKAATAIAFAPDSKTLAVADDDLVHLFPLAAGKTDTPLPAKKLGRVTALNFSPDGKFLAAGGKTGAVVLWELNGNRERASFAGQGEVSCVAFSPDGKWLTAAGPEPNVRLWELGRGDPIEKPSLKGQGGPIHVLSFDRDGKTLFAAGRDGSIRSWESITNQPRFHTLVEGRSFDTTALAWSPGNGTLAAGTRSGSVRWWTAANGGFKGQPEEVRALPVQALALAPDGQSLLFNRGDGLVRRATLTSKEFLEGESPLPGHPGGERELVVAPDGTVFAGGSAGPSVKLWGLPEFRELAELPTAGKVRALGFTTDSKLLAVGGADDAPHIWALGDRGMADRGALPGPPGHVQAAAFDPTAQKLAASGTNGIVALWDTGGKDMRKQADLPSQPGPVQPLAFTAGGQCLACGGGDRAVRLWHVGSAEVRAGAVLRNLPGKVQALAFAPDGRRLAVAGPNYLHLWDSESGQRLKEWWLPGGVTHLLFASDGRHLLMGNDNGTIYVLRIEGP